MADIAALWTSNNQSYCTPPTILKPMRLVLVPSGSGRKLVDPATNTNGQTLVKAHYTADGITTDGLTMRWSIGDCWWNNPPFDTIEQWAALQAYWGREVGLPGMSIQPGRTETRWYQRHIKATADATLELFGRETFWLPIPLDKRDADPPKEGKDGKPKEPYYLRRWFPAATDADLPDPFLPLEDRPGWAIGPELGKDGRPQSPPFGAVIAFWADPNTVEPDPRNEREALRELVRVAVEAMQKRERDEQTETWLAECERLLGSKRFRSRTPLDLGPFERLAAETRINPVSEHPISIRAFERHFRSMGTLTIARGPHAGVYQRGRRVG